MDQNWYNVPPVQQQQQQQQQAHHVNQWAQNGMVWVANQYGWGHWVHPNANRGVPPSSADN